jgi:hypothetical protein
VGSRLSVLEHLAERCGIRKTSRLVGVPKDTVSRLHRIAGLHTKALHDKLVGDLAIAEVQFDGKVGLRGGKKRNISAKRRRLKAIRAINGIT